MVFPDRGRAGVLLAIGLLVAGCQSMGPGTVRQDRLHYSMALSDSWKEQLLLNIVKSRYGDVPAFLEVASVVSGYTVESRISGGGEWQPNNPEDVLSLGASRTYTDRPTISYTPLSGEKFARSLMAPLPLESLTYASSGGVPIDFIFSLAVQAFEGHYNADLPGVDVRPADPGFQEAISLLRALQLARAMEIEVVRVSDRVELWLEFLPADPVTSETAGKLLRLKSLLKIPPELGRVKLVFGNLAPSAETIALRTRSLMQMMRALGAGVLIPAQDLADGRARATDTAHAPGGFTVRSGPEKPKEAFTLVPYGGNWFWIEPRDLTSKDTLTIVAVLFNFLDSGAAKAAPVLTIPAN